ncbi:hypothetical protein J4H86_04965 [Spiractinospora alimapuensis]|uniref:transglutaminase family protein n=1 Tax=Spiractinospora alimapuensis TaxID=2820884 RepID=UPI001F3E00D8|nr:DUF3488 and transglutaminase-like domain-containing protein [Spiractinospora alimapuensis]QVQ53143.1 hypothetical protein J4H86_04965 [Spiractinospora alimapuensis]
MRRRLALAAAVATAAGVPQLHPLFLETSWIVVPLGMVLAVSLLRVLVESLGRGTIVVLLAQSVGVLLVLTTRFAGSSALLGVVPTPGSLADLGVLLARGVVEIQTNPAPISASPAIVVVTSLAVALVAILVDQLAVTFRAPALTGLPLAGLALVPLFVHYQGTNWLAFSLAAGGFLCLLAVDGWARTHAWHGRTDRLSGAAAVGAAGGLDVSRLATRTGAIALAAALLVPVFVPHLTGDALYTWAGDRRSDGESVTTVHPLVSLQRDLRSSPEEVVLTYETDASRPEYLRTHALDTFDGENWTMSPLNAGRQHLVDEESLPTPPGRGSGEVVETSIQLADHLRAVDFLAMPYPAREVTAPGAWYVDPESLMVFTVSDPARGGSSYTVRTEAPVADAEALARVRNASPSVHDRYLELPDSVSADVADLTERVTEDADGPHEAAVALQDWFTGGDFDYDLDPPSVPENADPLDDFVLDQRTGYCEQFAGAMAVMARLAGIPSRVGVGYTPGERRGDDWVVRRQNAHAWPELYFEGYGWLRFEPTPASTAGQGNAAVPSWAQAAQESAPEESEASTAEDGDDPAAQGDEETPPDAGEDPLDSELAEDEGGVTTRSPLDSTPIVVTLLIVLVVLVTPWVFRTAVRGWRFARAGDDSARAGAAWSEIRDTCRDLSLPWSSAHSPRAASRALLETVELPKQARRALWRIASAEEQARYAPHAPVAPSLRADTHTVRSAVLRSVSRRARLRAIVLPRSLWPLGTDRLDRTAGIAGS